MFFVFLEVLPNTNKPHSNHCLVQFNTEGSHLNAALSSTINALVTITQKVNQIWIGKVTNQNTKIRPEFILEPRQWVGLETKKHGLAHTPGSMVEYMTLSY